MTVLLFHLEKLLSGQFYDFVFLYYLVLMGYVYSIIITGISNVKSREDLVMSGSDSSDPFQNAPFKKQGKFCFSHP